MMLNWRLNTLLVSHGGPVRPTMSETTALGAAMAAGAAEGVNVWNLSSTHLPKVMCEKYEPQINTDGKGLKQDVSDAGKSLHA